MTDRRCGDCTLCCKLLPVKELEKGANTRCQHQSRKGCAIYHQLGFPPSCGLWNCAWLGGEDLPRPDRCGWVVDIVPDEIQARNNETGEVQSILVAQVWVEPGCEPTFDPKLRRYAERCAEKNTALLLRFGSGEGVAVFAPKFATDGKWHFVRHSQMTLIESPSGNLLLDRLKAEREEATRQLPAAARSAPGLLAAEPADSARARRAAPRRSSSARAAPGALPGR